MGARGDLASSLLTQFMVRPRVARGFRRSDVSGLASVLCNRRGPFSRRPFAGRGSLAISNEESLALTVYTASLALLTAPQISFRSTKCRPVRTACRPLLEGRRHRCGLRRRAGRDRRRRRRRHVQPTRPDRALLHARQRRRVKVNF